MLRDLSLSSSLCSLFRQKLVESAAQQKTTTIVLYVQYFRQETSELPVSSHTGIIRPQTWSGKTSGPSTTNILLQIKSKKYLWNWSMVSFPPIKDIKKPWEKSAPPNRLQMIFTSSSARGLTCIFMGKCNVNTLTKTLFWTVKMYYLVSFQSHLPN